MTLIAALLVGSAVPASATAASPFASTVIRDACKSAGGTWDNGFIVLKVGAAEFGESGANYFKFRARLQRWVNAEWVTADTIRWTTDAFPDDDATWSWWFRARWSFRRETHRPTRITMRVQFWDKRPGDDRLLATHRHVGTSC